MKCSEVRESLLFYLLEELPPEDAVRIGGHVRECVPCGVELDALRRDVGTLHAGLHQEVVPSVRLAVQASRALAPPPARPWLSRPLFAVGVALTAFLGAALLRPSSPPPLTAAALAADHREMSQQQAPAQLQTSDAAAGAAWLAPRLGFVARPVRLAEKDALLGVRHCRIARQHLGAFFLENGGKRITLFQAALPPDDISGLQPLPGTPYRYRETAGCTILAWRQEPLTLILVAEQPPSDVLRHARQVAVTQ